MHACWLVGLLVPWRAGPLPVPLKLFFQLYGFRQAHYAFQPDGTRTKCPSCPAGSPLQWIAFFFCANCDMAVELCYRIEFVEGKKYGQSKEEVGDFITFLDENEIPMTEFRERLDHMNATLLSKSTGCNNLRGMPVDAVEGTYWGKNNLQDGFVDQS